MLKSAIVLIAGILSFSAAQAESRLCLNGLKIATNQNVIEIVKADVTSVEAKLDGEKVFAQLEQKGSSVVIKTEKMHMTQIENHMIEIQNSQVVSVTHILQDDVDFGSDYEETQEAFTVLNGGSCN